MAMALNDAKEWEIMLHGHWKSNAFLDYICPQAAAFNSKLTEEMIKEEHKLYTTTTAKGQTTKKPAAKSDDCHTNIQQQSTDNTTTILQQQQQQQQQQHKHLTTNILLSATQSLPNAMIKKLVALLGVRHNKSTDIAQHTIFY